MSEQTRGIVMAFCGILVLALNVIEAVDRGATAWNLVTIATGAFLLFYGVAVISARGAPAGPEPGQPELLRRRVGTASGPTRARGGSRPGAAPRR